MSFSRRSVKTAISQRHVFCYNVIIKATANWHRLEKFTTVRRSIKKEIIVEVGCPALPKVQKEEG